MGSPVRFAEVKKLLESHGWQLTRIAKSSHHVFTKPGEWKAFSVPVHRGKVKYKYVHDIKKYFGEA